MGILFDKKKGIARSLYMMLEIKKTNKDNKYLVKY